MKLRAIGLILILLAQLPVSGFAEENKCNKAVEDSEVKDAILNREQIEELLPHRGFMLLVDRVVHINPYQSAENIQDIPLGTRVTAELDIHKDLEVFEKHYPGNPIFPGFLLAEAIAQAGGLMVLQQLRGEQTEYPVLLATKNMELQNPVVPNGRTYPLKLEVVLVEKNGAEFIFNGLAILPNGKVSMKLDGIKATLLNEKIMRRFLRPPTY